MSAGSVACRCGFFPGGARKRRKETGGKRREVACRESVVVWFTERGRGRQVGRVAVGRRLGGREALNWGGGGRRQPSHGSLAFQNSAARGLWGDPPGPTALRRLGAASLGLDALATSWSLAVRPGWFPSWLGAGRWRDCGSWGLRLANGGRPKPQWRTASRPRDSLLHSRAAYLIGG